MDTALPGVHRRSPFLDTVNCSTDWRCIAVTLLGVGGHQFAAAYLTGVSITFEVDGTPVTGPTFPPIKPFVLTGIRGQSERASAS